MDIHDAAKKLYASLNVPLGSLNVIPISDAKEEYLLIWISQDLSKIHPIFPKFFDNYRIVVETRPQIIAHSSKIFSSFLRY